MYKKVLAAYDGSEKSQAALDHAADIVDYHKGFLIIVHVVKEKSPAPSYDPVAVAEKETDMSVREEKPAMDGAQAGKGGFLLKKARNRLYLEDNQIKTELLYGDPVKEILNYAKEEKVDLLVLGNRGLNGLRKFMLGSVSKKVAQDAECPVLIVK